jgi:MinD superfamily P-loop ATPase
MIFEHMLLKATYLSNLKEESSKGRVDGRDRLIIAVASGKGGTGKTTIAVHLALASAATRKTSLVDLDVEAPDSLGYFPEAMAEEESTVKVRVPRLDETKCSGCGRCTHACRFGAIVAIGPVITIDEAVCKACGRCVAACPASALSEAEIEVGTLSLRRSGELSHLEGRLQVGDIRSTAVIEAAKRRGALIGAAVEIRDCPPGVSCPAVHSIVGSDYVVLVAEPTEFSLHDLGAALELVRSQGLAAGVVVNKDGFGSADVAALASGFGVPIISRIPFSRERAERGARAGLMVDDEGFMREMAEIRDAILGRTRTEARR